MKWNPIGALLARFQRGPATSVSPESDIPAFLRDQPGDALDMAGRSIAKRLREVDQSPLRPRRVTGGIINVDPRGKTREQIEQEIADQINVMREQNGMSHLPPVKLDELSSIMDQVDQAIAGRRPPPINPHTGERLPYPEDITWSRYTAMRDRAQRKGWVFCRIGCQSVDDGCTQPFGIVREEFGVFWQSFWSCGHETEVPYACLVHLKSGGGLGIFADLTLACDAAESLLAIRDIHWPDIDPQDRENFGKITKQIETAWEFIGARTAPWCIHEVLLDQNDIGPAMKLYVRENEKPEGKLS